MTPDKYFQWAQREPVQWVREVLGKDPTPYQEDLLRSVRDNRKSSMGSCHSAGKSEVMGGQVLPWWLCSYPGSVVVTTAPTFRQVRGIIWDRVRDSVANAKIPLGPKPNLTEWHLGAGWYAQGMTAPDTDANKFQGFHSKAGRLLCIVDEAAGVSEAIFNGGIFPITVGEGDRLCLIGNTTSTVGEFRNSSRPGSGYNYLKVSAFETPNFQETGITLEDITSGEWEKKLDRWRKANPGRSLPRPYLISPVWVADRAANWGVDSVLFRTRIMAEFLDEGANVLASPAWVELAQARDLNRKGRTYDGLDVAGRGVDWSVYGRLSMAGCYRTLWRLARNDTVTLVSKVRETVATGAFPQALAVDDSGIGTGVADLLIDRPPVRAREVGSARQTKVLRFIAGGRSDQPDRFPNMRSQIAWRVRQLLENGELDLDPNDHELAEELSSIQWSISPKHAFVLERKEDYIQRMGRSPDNFDALCYAVYAREVAGGGISWA